MEYLAKNFSPCAWCVKHGDDRNIYDNKGDIWINDYILFEQLKELPVSHSICPSCRKTETDLLDAIVLEKGE